MAEKKKRSEKVDKRYRAKVTVDGRPVYVSAKTKQELQQKKVAAREHLRDGVDDRRDILFVDLVREWWNNDKKPRIKSPSTMRNYETTLRCHLLPNLDDRQMARAVTRRDLQACLDAQAGKNTYTVRSCASILRAVCQMAVLDRRLTYDPSYGLVKPDAKPETKRGALTDDQVDAIMDVAAKNGQRGLLLYILYYLGLRRNEALGLRWGDFDFDGGYVHIARSLHFGDGDHGETIPAALKTENADRVLPIPEQLADVLRPYRGLPGVYLFSMPNGEPFTYYEYRQLWHELMTQAGLARLNDRGETEYDVTAHWFRHNYLTMLFDAGIPAETGCRLAGHSRYSTTVDTYIHIQKERLKEETKKLDGVFNRRQAKKNQDAK